MYKLFISLLIASVLFTSCSESAVNKEEELDIEGFSETLLDEEFDMEVDKEAIGDIIQNISSPVEMSALLKDEGIEFNYKYLSSTDNVDEFVTSFKQALNLGVLGADMGYLNMYNKTGAVLNYITAIKELSEELKVGQFFNFETLKRLATNNENIDSLMYISISAFDNMDTYLRDNGRSNISALLVTGVWVEGAYLASQVALENDNVAIRERVAEQGVIMDQLMLVLNHYKKDPQFFKLITELNNLKVLLDKVEIIEEEGESEMMEVDGVLMVVSDTKTTVNVSDELLADIISEISRIRSYVISYN